MLFLGDPMGINVPAFSFLPSSSLKDHLGAHFKWGESLKSLLKRCFLFHYLENVSLFHSPPHFSPKTGLSCKVSSLLETKKNFFQWAPFCVVDLLSDPTPVLCKKTYKHWHSPCMWEYTTRQLSIRSYSNIEISTKPNTNVGPAIGDL